MSQQNSILDKIIQSKQMQEASQFDPNEIISNLIKNLSLKERDVLSRRFGLSGQEKETLEQIGKHYQITRERIRQIEVSTIKKLKELKEFTEQIEVAEHNVNRLLENYGGVMEENHLINELLTYADMNPTNRQASLFILSNLLNDKLHLVKSDKDVHTGWKLPTFPLDTLKQTLNELTDIINNENRLLKTEELLNIFKSRESFENHRQQLTNLFGVDLDNKIDKFLNSYLIISKKLNQNILGEWGLSHWNTVSPKRMGDKVYLVLRKTGKPLHFTEISDLINQTGFDKKVAYPPTIHN